VSIPVVPTKARRAAWRDLLSTISRLDVERKSLGCAALRAASLVTTVN